MPKKSVTTPRKNIHFSVQSCQFKARSSTMKASSLQSAILQSNSTGDVSSCGVQA